MNQENPFIGWIEHRIKKNKNAIGLFVGATGSGKSLACINTAKRLSEVFGTPFSIEGNVSFDFRDMLRKMQLEENSKPGTCFVLEEVGSVGSGAASTQWQSKANAFFSSFLQTTRHRNQILLLNTPAYGFLMKSARMLLHFQVEMASINQTDKTSSGKFYICQTNARSGKVYMKYLRVTVNGSKQCFPMMKFYLPDKELINAYEKKKFAFTSQLNQQIIETDDKGKRLEVGQVKKGKQGEHIMIDYDKLRAYIKKGVMKNDIAKVFGVCKSTLFAHIHKLEEMDAEV